MSTVYDDSMAIAPFKEKKLRQVYTTAAHTFS